MRIVSVVGARPQFVKLAPVARAMRDAGLDHRIVHTGQHYDEVMSDVFFRDLDIPPPHRHLGTGSGTHGRQTGAMLAGLDAVFEEDRPDWVLVYGDTNSTLAGALSAVKMGIRVAHLEAGLRSFNRRMPEEHNRILTDHAADLCLAPTQSAMAQLVTEGLESRSVLVGDVMTDVLLGTREVVADRQPLLPVDLNAGEPFVVATLHRAENTDDAGRLHAIVRNLAGLATPVMLLAHPRLRQRAREFDIALDQGSVMPTEPYAYPDLVRLVMSSTAVVTDSGGLQKEAFLLRTPCITVRTETEWRETVDLGWNVLVPDPDELGTAFERLRPQATDAEPYGDGRSAGRVVQAIQAAHDRSRTETTTLASTPARSSNDP